LQLRYESPAAMLQLLRELPLSMDIHAALRLLQTSGASALHCTDR